MLCNSVLSIIVPVLSTPAAVGSEGWRVGGALSVAEPRSYSVLCDRVRQRRLRQYVQKNWACPEQEPGAKVNLGCLQIRDKSRVVPAPCGGRRLMETLIRALSQDL